MTHLFIPHLLIKQHQFVDIWMFQCTKSLPICYDLVLSLSSICADTFCALQLYSCQVNLMISKMFDWCLTTLCFNEATILFSSNKPWTKYKREKSVFPAFKTSTERWCRIKCTHMKYILLWQSVTSTRHNIDLHSLHFLIILSQISKIIRLFL